MKILQNIASLKKVMEGQLFLYLTFPGIVKLGEEVSLVSEVEEHLNEKERLIPTS